MVQQIEFDLFTEQQTPQIYNAAYEEFKKGDMVRVIASKLDFEALNYFEYYRPCALKSPGIVAEIEKNYLVVVFKNGEEIQIEKEYIKKEE